MKCFIHFVVAFASRFTTHFDVSALVKGLHILFVSNNNELYRLYKRAVQEGNAVSNRKVMCLMKSLGVDHISTCSKK